MMPSPIKPILAILYVSNSVKSRVRLRRLSRTGHGGRSRQPSSSGHVHKSVIRLSREPACRRSAEIPNFNAAGGEMEAAQSDALVFFGASGDLAFKQIFPALLGL